MKTWHAKPNEIEKHWWLVDASGKSLGRLATVTSDLLRGKRKPEFTPHIDTGDFVIIINAKNLYLSGRKWINKKYYSHSGFFGSLKEKSAKELSPTQLIEKAVYGMLPKNKMRNKWIKKLKVYETAKQPHQAQTPSSFIFTEKKRKTHQQEQ